MPASKCTGQGVDGTHCCWVNGQPCPFLVENVAGRRYACGLMLRYGTWPVVIRSREYVQVGEHWEMIGQPYHYCMSFDPVFCCQREAE